MYHVRKNRKQNIQDKTIFRNNKLMIRLGLGYFFVVKFADKCVSYKLSFISIINFFESYRTSPTPMIIVFSDRNSFTQTLIFFSADF